MELDEYCYETRWFVRYLRRDSVANEWVPEAKIRLYRSTGLSPLSTAILIAAETAKVQ